MEDTRGCPGSVGLEVLSQSLGAARVLGSAEVAGQGDAWGLSRGAQQDCVSIQGAPELGNIDCSVFVNNL